MIRVLQYIGSLKQGGSQAMIMNLYRGIDKDKIQFDFVIHDGVMTSMAEEAIRMGARVFSCPKFSLLTLSKYKKWWKEFFDEHNEIKILHCHVRSPASTVLKIAKKHGVTSISHSHSASYGKSVNSIIKRFLARNIKNNADYFMGCSLLAGEFLYGKNICKSDRYFSVKNAIDSKKYVYNLQTAKEVREEFNYTDNDVVIGHVGRFSQPKNHIFLIDIFNEIHKKDDKYKLLLVGDGELRKGIEEKVEKLGLRDFVSFVGLRTDINRIFMGIDLFLFPSLWEGLPVSVVEAQASGLKCVISSAISTEVIISPLVTAVDLSRGEKEWANIVVENLGNERQDTSKYIIESGYDIKQSVDEISRLYLGLHNSIS